MAASAVYAVVVSATFPHWFVDDGYMLLRYGSNLAHSGAPVFNLHGSPVEGETGIALTGLLALASLAHVPLEWADHAIGVVSFFLAALTLGLVLRALKASPMATAAATALFLTTPILYVHAFSGLETSLFLLLVNTSFLLLVWLLKQETKWSRNAYLLSLALLMTSLCRPEGVAIAAVFIATALLYYLRRHRAHVRGLLVRFAVAYGSVGVVYFVWRVSYYGRLLPNTYYAKTSQGLSSAVVDEITQFAPRYVLSGLVLATAFLATKLAVSRGSEDRQRRTSEWSYQTAALAGALVATGAIVASYLTSSLENDYSFRFVIPYYGLLLIVLAYGIDQLAHALAGDGNQLVRSFVAIAVVLAISLQLGINVQQLQGQRDVARSEKRLLDGEDITVGKRLEKILPPDAVVVSYQAGAVAWFSKREVIDLVGLNDRTLSNQRLTPQQVTDYVFSKNPRAIVLEADRPRSNWIIADPRIHSFQLIGQYHTGYLTELVYVRS